MLDVSHLSISFSRYGKGLQKSSFSPVSDISLHINAGEIVAVVGSSGSGKSLLAHALLGLLPGNARMGGQLTFKDTELIDERIHLLRGREIALIPQSVAYLNPLARVGRQVFRAARLSGQPSATANRNTDTIFRRYALASPVRRMFPFQISGGMARRVLTATATVGQADLIIADEPTTGLDRQVAQKTLSHLVELADDGKGVLLITHDLAAAVRISNLIVVVYAGKTLEITSAMSFHSPEKLLHPYTRALWNALPQNSFTPLAGNQPTEDHDISGCIFNPRCPVAVQGCRLVAPTLQKINGSLVRCLHAAG